MLKRRNRIVYIPFPEKNTRINEYTINMVNVLQQKYFVVGTMEDIFHMFRTKAVFLNWMENELDKRVRIKLMLYKALGAKVVWIFHNKYPHDTKHSREIIDNMRWLANNSSIIILHSKSSIRYIPNVQRNRKKAAYVPHIIYTNHDNMVNSNDIRKKYSVSEKDFLFTIFGGVKPYKNIEKCIEVFHRLHLEKAKLLIAGYPYNAGYAKKIRMLCKENQNIILDFRFIPDETLDSIIAISDVILLPYKEGSSMNSGVMIKAFSQGKTVIVPDICMARDMSDNKFFYMYKDSFEEAMMEAYQSGKIVNKRMGEAARDYVYKYNNREVIGKRLDEILG